MSLILLPGAEPKGTAASVWRRQSYPAISLQSAADGPDVIRRAARLSQFIFFAGSQDLLHPSLAGAVISAGADVVTWNRFCADEPRAGSPGIVLRRPPFDSTTWRHGSVTDTTIAVRGSVLANSPDAVLLALAEGRMHPLLFWLAGQDVTWATHPEALTSNIGEDQPSAVAPTESDRELFAQILSEEGARFTLESAPDAALPVVLLPVQRPCKVSAILCFRDKAELTLRCIRSLARQHLTGEFELVLVDNQTSAIELRRIVTGARAMLGEERVVLVSYDAPFNHSAQNNLGVKAASGDVVLMCNNDVTVDDPTAVEQMAAWALQDGVGAVGCRLENPGRQSGSYGLRHRQLSDDPFRPPLEECHDPTYARHVHACAGATLALAAMSRDRYLALGGLDELAFPAGYNDMDLMFRATREGLTHLYLGHVTATHWRGSSRVGEDEDLQVLRINQRYPDQTGRRFLQLSRERVEGGNGARRQSKPADAAKLKAPPKPDASLSGEAEALLKARNRLEADRGEMAKALSAAARLSQALSDELAAASAIVFND